MNNSNEIHLLINEIIPPNDYQHRNGFSNEYIIDNLSDETRSKVETELIRMFLQEPDVLIVETLGYMKSHKSLPILYKFMESLPHNIVKIITAASIFNINQEKEMIDVIKKTFSFLERMVSNNQNFENVDSLITAFYYLTRFQDPQTMRLVKRYTNSPNHTISFNAKQALGLYRD